MASLMEELLTALKEEEDRYVALIDLAAEKKEAIIKADLPKLDEINIREERITSDILNLSHKRAGVLGDMATVLGKNPADMDITKLIGYLNSQPVEQEKLIRQRDSLLEAGSKMHAANQQNQILLQQALEMVEFDLTLLRSMKQAPETANYDKNAYNTGALLGSSGFDAKQ